MFDLDHIQNSLEAHLAHLGDVEIKLEEEGECLNIIVESSESCLDEVFDNAVEHGDPADDTVDSFEDEYGDQRYRMTVKLRPE